MVLPQYQPKKNIAQKPQPAPEPATEEELLSGVTDEQLRTEFIDVTMYRLWNIRLQARIINLLKEMSIRLDNLAVEEINEELEFPEPKKK